MTRVQKVKRKEPRSTKAGRGILASLKAEVDAVERGEPRTMRTYEIPDEPTGYTAADVARVREKLKVSQAIFAHMIGVSTVLVSHVEQGRIRPSRIMRRMLDIMQAEPQVVTKFLRPKVERPPLVLHPKPRHAEPGAKRQRELGV